MGPSSASTIRATPSHANIAAQCSRTASSSAIRAIPAPIAVKICTENAAARADRDVDEEFCWLEGFISPAVLSGIVWNCTSGLAAFRRAKQREHYRERVGLKTSAQTSIVRR